jgi:hypothetical protein
MFDWIPLAFYLPIFYNFILILVVIAIIKIRTKENFIGHDINDKLSSLLLLIILTFFIGLRPVSGRYFGDMATYNAYFELYATGASVTITKDIQWHYFMKFCSAIMSSSMFFLICEVLYILPLYLACKRWFKGGGYTLFLMFIASFSFFTYGTNGIRNGIATSILVLAFSHNKAKSLKKYLLFLLATIIHLSSIVPIFAYVLSVFFKKTKYYIYGWLLAIPLSLVLGSFWENLFASLGFGGERISYLTAGNVNNDSFAYAGFRYDFVLYSAAAVYTGYYFVIKKKIKDKIYLQIFNIYLVSNAFWILIIRANFSNRFAYLSWFLMAFVIFYPFLKQRFFKDQQKVLVLVMMIYFGFTYLMFLKN